MHPALFSAQEAIRMTLGLFLADVCLVTACILITIRTINERKAHAN